MDNRRRTARNKTFLQGRMLFNGGRSSVDCVIRDISEFGARLKFSCSIPTPDHFELYIPNRDERREAFVQWRRDDEVGISFERDKPVDIVPRASEGGENSDRGEKMSLEERMRRLEDEVAALRRMVARLRADSQSSRDNSV